MESAPIEDKVRLSVTGAALEAYPWRYQQALKGLKVDCLGSLVFGHSLTGKGLAI
jgi:hypothetical protein